MYTLYYYPSNANLAPHMLLEEIGAPYRLVLVDRDKEAHKSSEYLKLNPAGLIPVLVDGDLVLPETAAICMHLVDKHPDIGLAPPLGTAERAHFYRWLVYLTNTLQAEILIHAYPQRLADDEAGAQAVKRHAQARISGMLDLIERHLLQRGPWMLGASYSAVDPFLFVLCRWTRNMPSPARSRPHIKALLDAMMERPAVQRAHAQEELVPPFY
ncbi:MAG: glutathione S-transferase family protein [Polyangiales bacterium]